MHDFTIRQVIKLKKLHDDAIIPKSSDGNVGYDIVTYRDITLKPLCVTKIDVGWAFAQDIGCCLIGSAKNVENTKYFGLTPFFKIEGRSGLASKNVFPVGGIIDPSYRGEVGVLLYNGNSIEYNFKAGDRIAQLVCYHTMSPSPVAEIMFKDGYELVATARNSDGFGSTGA